MDSLSVLVFRLGKEWLALSTIFIKEVTHSKPFHAIPHHGHSILKGFVNIDGEMKLAVSLHELLKVEPISGIHQSNRMIAIVNENDNWVFPVDEIDGIYHWVTKEIEPIPVGSSSNYTKGRMVQESKSIGLLDEELLFTGLKRSLQ